VHAGDAPGGGALFVLSLPPLHGAALPAGDDDDD
jgi:hypothetical protein